MTRQEEMIGVLAEKIRSEYCRQRERWEVDRTGASTKWGKGHIPRWDGGQSGDGTRHRSVWEQAANKVIQKRYDPTRFVEAQFAVRWANVPQPSHLLSEKAEEIYESRRQEDSSTLLRLFTFQQNRFVSALQLASLSAALTAAGPKAIQRSVLTDLMVDISALFRYCVAYSENHQDIVEKFELLALEQYLGQPDDYDRIWGSWIPAALKKQLSELSKPSRPMTADEVIAQVQPNPRTLCID